MQRRLSRCDLGVAQARLGNSAHLHGMGVEAHTKPATEALGILEEEHLPAFTFIIFHLFVRKEPGVRDTLMYLCNFNL